MNPKDKSPDYLLFLAIILMIIFIMTSASYPDRQQVSALLSILLLFFMAGLYTVLHFVWGWIKEEIVKNIQNREIWKQ